MKQKRPIGQEWEQLVTAWYDANHAGKIAIARAYGATYGTLKHWISDQGATQKKEESRSMQMNVKELLGMTPAKNLDFVMFDLETSGFDADWDILLTCAIKPFGQPTKTWRADVYPTWATERANDRQMTIDIATELATHAVVIGHYSSKFDVKFLRAKMIRHGLEPLPPMFGLDTWKIALDNFKVSNRRMRSLANFVGIGEKEEVDGTRWMRAAFNGDTKAMDAILAHNILDVEILEKLACLSFGYVKSIPRL
uniref:Putative RNase_H superfamily protein n=1 Tax=viral metagenome TaxID=1070528 RepID=A0A6M3KUZ6_9ZZZZ